MIYTNLPVYIGSGNADTITEAQSYILSNSVSVDYPTQANPNRKQNKSIDRNDQLKFSGPSEVSISVDMMFHTDKLMSGCAFLYDEGNGGNNTGQNYFTIKIGDNVFNKCYLNDYSINIKPFEPVTCNANFVSYEPAIKESISGDYSLSSIEDDIDTNKIIYGYTCSVVSANQAVSDNVLSSITYKKSYNRTPIYTIGSIYPTKYLLNGAEVEMGIESTGLNSLIDYSGSKLTSDVTISLQDQDGGTITPLSKSALSFTMYSGAIITSEKYSMQQGDSVASSATIKEIMV